MLSLVPIYLYIFVLDRYLLIHELIHICLIYQVNLIKSKTFELMLIDYKNQRKKSILVR